MNDLVDAYCGIAEGADFDDPRLEGLRELMTDKDCAGAAERLRGAAADLHEVKLWAWRRKRPLH